MKLKGKVAVITGGGTGIGRAAAIALAAEGARVVVMARRPGPLNETVDIIKEAGGEGLAIPSDVTVIEDIEKARHKVRETYSRLDILVNNAGSALFKPFMKTSLEDFDRIYQVDLRSVFAVSQLMLPLMLEGGGGSIINISSILGVLGGKSSSAYCAMKGEWCSLRPGCRAGTGDTD